MRSIIKLLPLGRNASLAALTLSVCTAIYLPSADAAKLRTIAGVGAETQEGQSRALNNKADDKAAAMTVAYPMGMAVDGNGTIFTTDSKLQRVAAISQNRYRTLAKSAGLILNDKKSILLPEDSDRNPKALPPRTNSQEIETWNPIGIAVRPNGTLIVADSFNHQIIEITLGAKGRYQLKAIAGTGVAGLSEDGAKATSAKIDAPYGLALDLNGDVLFTDANNLVQRISNGVLTTVAGNCKPGRCAPGFSGDGGKAIDAQLHGPAGLAVGEEGEIFVADLLNDRIRLIRDGVINTVAGTGEAGFNMRDGSADKVDLNGPYSLAYVANGILLFSECHGHVVRQLSLADKTIKTIVGDGEPGISPDGTEANQASLNSPSAIAVTPKGELLIVDFRNNAIRAVSLGLPTPFHLRPRHLDIDAALEDILGVMPVVVSPKTGGKGSKTKAEKNKTTRGVVKDNEKARAETAAKMPVPEVKPTMKVESGQADLETPKIVDPAILAPSSTTVKKKKKKKAASQRKRTTSENQVDSALADPFRLDEDDIGWTEVARVHKWAAAEKRIKPLTAGQLAVQLLDQGEGSDPSEELQRACSTLVKDLLDSWDEEWSFAWEKHILPRHGSKTRALAFQTLDKKTRSFFTIGTNQAGSFARRTVEAFVDSWQLNEITHYWAKTVEADDRVVHKLVLETPNLNRDIGRDAAPEKKHVMCQRLRVVLGLGEEGLWIASCYPVA